MLQAQVRTRNKATKLKRLSNLDISYDEVLLDMEMSLMAQEVVPRRRGRPGGSKNKRSQKLHGHLVPRWEPRVEKQVVGEVGDAPEEGEEDILEICCNHSLMCSPCLAPEG